MSFKLGRESALVSELQQPLQSHGGGGGSRRSSAPAAPSGGGGRNWEAVGTGGLETWLESDIDNNWTRDRGHQENAQVL